jgi:hypothetical protein
MNGLWTLFEKAIAPAPMMSARYQSGKRGLPE